ncbi:hypothetical protein A0H76_677 [Hepatospora eriocheir]|uniref:Uncharacterized protein n=1 Tax=Hepatospora eriocheir TaxID=1081669 RepID=A0A1X0QIH8_9MICR|nr:hypothetical protein A0H76_677 [Hepatospora eriocheir]
MILMNILFALNTCFCCYIVKNDYFENEYILEEDEEITEAIKNCDNIKIFMIKNVPLILKLVESEYLKKKEKEAEQQNSCEHLNDENTKEVNEYKTIKIIENTEETNLILSQLTKNFFNFKINFLERNISLDEVLTIEECIYNFIKYLNNVASNEFDRYKILIIKKALKDKIFELDNSKCLVNLGFSCINQIFDSILENHDDFKTSKNFSLLEFYIDFSTFYNFFKNIIEYYSYLRPYLKFMIEARKKMLHSYSLKAPNFKPSFNCDDEYLPRIEHPYKEIILNLYKKSTSIISEINESENIKDFFNELSKYFVKLIILLEKYNDSYNNEIFRFLIKHWIFDDNYNDFMR